ncbi:MAG: efflux RND transporter periplasmic adaptor subunit [Phycisphaerales bacterium]
MAHPITRQITRYLESTGTTEAFESVDLRARVPGFLERVNFEPGSEVHEGDLLFVIDKRTYQADVDRAAAQVLADEAAYQAAESDARIAEELFAQRAGSEIDKITKAGKRDAAKAAIEASKAALARAKLDLEFCEVYSPIDGRITKNFVDVGNLVGAAGQPTVLATVVQSAPMYVNIDSSESDLLMVRRTRLASSPGAEPGQLSPGVWRPVYVATADTDAFDIEGRIDYVDPALNPETGTIRVRCRFENKDAFLIPGLFVRVRIFLETADAVLAPDIALLSDQIGRFALVVDDEGKVSQRRVKIGSLEGTMRVVLEGLEPTDRLIVNGLQRARPGMKVNATLKEIDAAVGTPIPASGGPSTSAAPLRACPLNDHAAPGAPTPTGAARV